MVAVTFKNTSGTLWFLHGSVMLGRCQAENSVGSPAPPFVVFFHQLPPIFVGWNLTMTIVTLETFKVKKDSVDGFKRCSIYAMDWAGANWCLCITMPCDFGSLMGKMNLVNIDYGYLWMILVHINMCNLLAWYKVMHIDKPYEFQKI